MYSIYMYIESLFFLSLCDSLSLSDSLEHTHAHEQTRALFVFRTHVPNPNYSQNETKSKQ